MLKYPKVMNQVRNLLWSRNLKMKNQNYKKKMPAIIIK
jgi:hypothetical protein